MYDTFLTIVGNVLNPPEWRRTTNTGVLVTTFKIASTSRRRDRDTGQWVDGNSLRVRVNCWRALASNVASSVMVGDPLIVTGRLHTRDWTDEQGTKRTQYELEATAIGHDMTRGRNRFERVRANTSTSAVEDAPAQQRIAGEPTVPVPAGQAPAQFEDTPFHALEEPVEAPITPVARYDAVATPRGATAPTGEAGSTPDDSDPFPPDWAAGAAPDEPWQPADPLAEPADPRDPADPLAPSDPLEPDGAPDEQPERRRGSRRSKVPA